MSEGRRFIPSRRQVLEAGALAAVAALVGSICPAVPRGVGAENLAPLLPGIREMRDTLHKVMHGWAVSGTDALARKSDKQVYAVDVAQLMYYFARVADIEPYLLLREYAKKYLIVDNPDEKFTRGFVLWRALPGKPPDASGTTEGLRFAKALWLGAKTFNRPEDAELSLLILDGYARHQTVDKGIWMIRNYYGFGDQTKQGRFASNSYVIDYDPDFVREVADSFRGKDDARHAELSTLADHCYGVVTASVARCGLLYDLLQPEVTTMYYGINNIAYFSPNDVIQTNNSVTTSATVIKGARQVPERVLSFLLGQKKVFAHYYGRTGESASTNGSGASEYAGMARLAALLGSRVGVVAFAGLGISYWEWVVGDPGGTDAAAWTVSEVLLGLQEILEMGAA